MRDRALDQKICSLEDYRGKIVFLGGFRVFLEFLEGLERLGANDRGSCKILEFLGIFVEFLECIKGLGPTRYYFLKPSGLSTKSPGAQGL
jgi:hypothetical protein